jgi:hypothetical protein
VNAVVHPKIAAGRKDFQNSSKHSKTPITRVMKRPASGLVIFIPNLSLQVKLTDGLAAAENTDAVKSRVDERYRLITATFF